MQSLFCLFKVEMMSEPSILLHSPFTPDANTLEDIFHYFSKSVLEPLSVDKCKGDSLNIIILYFCFMFKSFLELFLLCLYYLCLLSWSQSRLSLCLVGIIALVLLVMNVLGSEGWSNWLRIAKLKYLVASMRVSILLFFNIVFSSKLFIILS
jgi:hypothetical protein